MSRPKREDVDSTTARVLLGILFAKFTTGG